MSQLKELEEYRMFTGPAEMHKAVNSLAGLLVGISSDGTITQDEFNELKMWYDNHRGLIQYHPFSEIVPQIDAALADGVLDLEEAQDLIWLCNQLTSEGYYSLMTSALQQLQGIMHGILADRIINDEEIRGLQEWLEVNEFLKGCYPFDEVDSLLASILADGTVTEEERNTLAAFFSEFIDTRDSCNLSEPEMEALRAQYSVDGICACDPAIEFEDHMFSFTGTSSRAKRTEIAEEIVAHRGIFNNNVTKNTQYLIVGGEGNPCWAFSCYGRKIEKAMEMRKNGSTIAIVHENDFWDAL